MTSKGYWFTGEEAGKVVLPQVQSLILRDFDDALKFPFRYVHIFLLGHIKNFLFPAPARITFGKRIKKNLIFYFIGFDVFGTTINCFSVKVDPFCPLF